MVLRDVVHSCCWLVLLDRVAGSFCWRKFLFQFGSDTGAALFCWHTQYFTPEYRLAHEIVPHVTRGNVIQGLSGTTSYSSEEVPALDAATSLPLSVPLYLTRRKHDHLPGTSE